MPDRPGGGRGVTGRSARDRRRVTDRLRRRPCASANLPSVAIGSDWRNWPALPPGLASVPDAPGRSLHLPALTGLEPSQAREWACGASSLPIRPASSERIDVVTLAANLSMLWTDLPFLDRFAAAADAGFTAVECLFPYEVPAAAVAGRLRAAGLRLALFNLPAGDWAGGERGLGALPDRVDEFRAGMATALDYARTLGTRRLHLMAGKPGDTDPAAARRTLIDNIRFAADAAAGDGIDIVLEPINTRIDMPGYYYDSTARAMDVIVAAERPNVKLQYDIYHMQVMEGDLARTIERLLPAIGHIQLADNPGRGEPGTGEINYPWLLGRIDALGYDGYVGCEYKPVGDTRAGLGWARDYLRRPARR